MLFADHYVLEWAGAIGGGITAVGLAILGLYTAFRKSKTAADKAERDAIAESKKIDSNAQQDVINDLRKDNEELRKQMTVIQSGVLVKIIEAHDEHHECERKYAALEAEHKHMKDSYEARLSKLEGK